ncbi:hypothetical protein Tco_1098456 [Tanacetum coccineum]
MFINFVIQNQYFSFCLEDFAQILDIPYEGACVFTDRWRLDEWAYGIPSDDPYQTNPPSIEDIISSIRIDLEGQARRIRHEEEIDILEYQVLTREIKPTLKPLEEIIREMSFVWGKPLASSNRAQTQKIEDISRQRSHSLSSSSAFDQPSSSHLNDDDDDGNDEGTSRARTPSLIHYVNSLTNQLYNESYVLYDRVMNPLAAQLERKPRRDRGTRRGRHSTSSSSAFDQPSSSHLNDDDDDGNDEGTSRASTPSPIRYVNSLTNQVPQVFQNPPNVDQNMEPFYTRQTKILNRQVQLRDEQRGGVRSIGKSLRRLWRNMRK